MGNPIIFINTNNAPKFCDNRCNNKECSRHISKLTGYFGAAKISKLKGMPECEGYITKRKQVHTENQQIKEDKRKAGIEK